MSPQARRGRGRGRGGNTSRVFYNNGKKVCYVYFKRNAY
jgi:hypothetical protein